MISIIICSRTKSIDSRLAKNIHDTIGAPYEVIVVDNSDNKYNIFEAYNLGVEESKYPILCFMHDDITYQNQNWGQAALAHFEDEQTGAIGIAGTPYATSMPGSWWGGILVNQYLLPVDDPDSGPKITVTYKEPAISNEVVLLDGVWLCLRKSLFDKISFDSSSYTGFHFYDVDISMQVHRLGYKLYSVFDVLISHNSKGNMNKNWIENALIFSKKWEYALPSSCIKLSYPKQCQAELRTLKELVNNMLYNGYTPGEAYKFAVLKLLKFVKGYFYYKTFLYLLHYSRLALSSKFVSH